MMKIHKTIPVVYLRNLAASSLAFTAIIILPTACKKSSESETNKEGSSIEQPIVDWEYEEFTITELKPVSLTEVFDEAKKAFTSGNLDTTSTKLQIVAGYFANEAENRSDEAKEAFIEYANQLENFADILEEDDFVTGEDLDEVFAKAHLILAMEHTANAQAAAKQNLLRKAGENISSAMDHSKQALERARAKASSKMSEAGDAVSKVAARLESEGEVTKEKTAEAMKKTLSYTRSTVEKVTTKLQKRKESAESKIKDSTGKILEKTGDAVERMGEKIKIKGAKIKPTPPE